MKIEIIELGHRTGGMKTFKIGNGEVVRRI